VISQSESLKADESLEARDEEDNSMSELQKIMSKLSVAKGEEPNNNVKKVRLKSVCCLPALPKYYICNLRALCL